MLQQIDRVYLLLQYFFAKKELYDKNRYCIVRYNPPTCQIYATKAAPGKWEFFKASGKEKIYIWELYDIISLENYGAADSMHLLYG